MYTCKRTWTDTVHAINSELARPPRGGTACGNARLWQLSQLLRWCKWWTVGYRTMFIFFVVALFVCLFAVSIPYNCLSLDVILVGPFVLFARLWTRLCIWMCVCVCAGAYVLVRVCGCTCVRVRIYEYVCVVIAHYKSRSISDSWCVPSCWFRPLHTSTDRNAHSPKVDPRSSLRTNVWRISVYVYMFNQPLCRALPDIILRGWTAGVFSPPSPGHSKYQDPTPMTLQKYNPTPTHPKPPWHPHHTKDFEFTRTLHPKDTQGLPSTPLEDNFWNSP
jgi:hypothetical protein